MLTTRLDGSRGEFSLLATPAEAGDVAGEGGYLRLVFPFCWAMVCTFLGVWIWVWEVWGIQERRGGLGFLG